MLRPSYWLLIFPTLNKVRRSPKLIFFLVSLTLFCFSTIVILFGFEVHVDVSTLCEINRKVPSLTQHRSSSSSSSLHQQKPIKFSILTFADSKAFKTYSSSIPSLLESRSIYADLYGYEMKTYFHKPEAKRRLVWSKVPAIYETLFGDDLPSSSSSSSSSSPSSRSNTNNSDSTYSIYNSNHNHNNVEHWVWVLDVDTLIFNYNVKLEHVVGWAGTKWAASASKWAAMDMIISMDMNGINAGSFMVRRSEWTRELLKRWWSRNDVSVPNIGGMFEQAALADLIHKDTSVASHVQIVPQRTFNAYGYPSPEESGLFHIGDFIVHCPSPSRKRRLPSYARAWERMMKECKLRELWMDGGHLLDGA